MKYTVPCAHVQRWGSDRVGATIVVYKGCHPGVPRGDQELRSQSGACQRIALLAATRVFFMSIAMVIGPTPPGTGVM